MTDFEGAQLELSGEVAKINTANVLHAALTIDNSAFPISISERDHRPKHVFTPEQREELATKYFNLLKSL